MDEENLSQQACGRCGVALAAIRKNFGRSHGRLGKHCRDCVGKHPTVERRFWVRVERRGKDECWPWIGGLKSSGGAEGLHNHGTASQLAWRFAYGEKPTGMLRHICGNVLCCNPEHLTLAKKKPLKPKRLPVDLGPRECVRCHVTKPGTYKFFARSRSVPERGLGSAGGASAHIGAHGN